MCCRSFLDDNTALVRLVGPPCPPLHICLQLCCIALHCIALHCSTVFQCIIQICIIHCSCLFALHVAGCLVGRLKVSSCHVYWPRQPAPPCTRVQEYQSTSPAMRALQISFPVSASFASKCSHISTFIELFGSKYLGHVFLERSIKSLVRLPACPFVEPS